MTEQDCFKNIFCASLSNAEREKLCAGCSKKFIKRGSYESYDDFSESAVLLLKGAMLFDTANQCKLTGNFVGRPTTFLAVPGRMLALDMTFFQQHNPRFFLNSVQCLSDCECALFKHEFIRSLFSADASMAQQFAKAMVVNMADASELSAILRRGFVYDIVYHLLCLLKSCNVYLNQQQIALVINRDRASISKALEKIRQADPGLWQKYRECKRSVRPAT